MADLNFLELYRLMADESTMGIVTFSMADHKCVYINKLAKEMLEISSEAKCNDLSLNALAPENVRANLTGFSLQLLNNAGLYQDILIKKQNNVTFIANLGVKRLQLMGSDIALLMMQDVTLQKKLQRDVMAKQAEIKTAYEELLTQNQQLKELDLAKNRFIALTTHELRTPLSAIVASAEILKLKLYETNEELEDFISMIFEQGNQLSALINDILDFAKIQAGKMDFYIEQLDLQTMAESIVEGLTSMAEGHEVKIEVKNHATPCLCYFDSIRMKQVITNIVTNAIKYNYKGGQVWVRIEEQEANFRLLVEDTGKGIADDQLKSVFNEFETLGKVALHHQGTGLGMPISRRLIEGMGGIIDLKSQLEKGTTFWIDVPKEKVLDESVYRSRPDAIGDLAA